MVMPSRLNRYISRLELAIAILSLLGLVLYVSLGSVSGADGYRSIPLYFVLGIGGSFLVARLGVKLFRGEFGSDQLAGVSIVTAVLLGEYVAGSLVVLMLAGGEALERFAVKKASNSLDALAKRMPMVAHRKVNGVIHDIALESVVIGDLIVVFPHETSPVDGVVIEGHTVMDESYLTGEPFKIAKTPGATVISGAINGESALTLRAEKLPRDSRYAKIMEVMQIAEAERPPLRRLGDRLGAWYTPLALLIAVGAWLLSGDPSRFLGVLVVATPCPLLIGIPVGIIGAISLCAQRGIIIRDPSVLEEINDCHTMILDKTGTLTYGTPSVTEVQAMGSLEPGSVLQLAGSLEQYSKHPLARSILLEMEKQGIAPLVVTEVSEKPGAGLRGSIDGKTVLLSNRKKVAANPDIQPVTFPATPSGMECVVVVNQEVVGLIRFHDEPRSESKSFVAHLAPKHKVSRTMIVSGDRESEVAYLAKKVGITEIYASQSPEQKVQRVREATQHGKTLFIGDGINDAPAVASATVGIAFGQNSDVTAESAGAVIMESSLHRVDELFHISHRMKQIILQSVIGGMGLSFIGMGFAAYGILTPVMGAIAQEGIDLLAVLNALRTAFPPRALTDYRS